MSTTSPHPADSSPSSAQLPSPSKPSNTTATNTNTPTFNSPKRKRDQPITPPPSSPDMRFNFKIPTRELVVPTADQELAAQGSPRTKVAYNFQGLRLDDGVGVRKLELQKSEAPRRFVSTKSVPGPGKYQDAQEAALRKRVKTLGKGVGKGDGEGEIPETPSREFTISIGPERAVDEAVVGSARGVVLMNEVDPAIFSGKTAVIRGNKAESQKKEPKSPDSDAKKDQEGALRRTYPSINRLADSKSRRDGLPYRTMVPPLFGPADASLRTNGGIEDGYRAALTWHDDEITGHDPSDPDDDGEGINGIGFRPTPAMAYARMEKRRQQLAEYRTREAKEARARRSERRRASEKSEGGRSEDSKKSREEKEAERRVRFMEVEKMSVKSGV